MATTEEINAALAKVRQRIAELEAVVEEGKRAQIEINKLNQDVLSNMKALRDLEDPFAKVTEFPATPASSPVDVAKAPESAPLYSSQAEPSSSPGASSAPSSSAPSSSAPSSSTTPTEESKADITMENLDLTTPIDLEKLQEMTKGADLLVLSRVYFSTADRAIREANQALINKDFRSLKALARELEQQSASYSAPEMFKLSKELEAAAALQDATSGKVFVEALKLALETVKSFVYAHHNA